MILSRIQGCCGVAELYGLEDDSPAARAHSDFYHGRGVYYGPLTIKTLRRVHKDAREEYNRSLLLTTVLNAQSKTRKALQLGGWRKYVHFCNVQTDRKIEVWGRKL